MNDTSELNADVKDKDIQNNVPTDSVIIYDYQMYVSNEVSANPTLPDIRAFKRRLISNEFPLIKGNIKIII